MHNASQRTASRLTFQQFSRAEDWDEIYSQLEDDESSEKKTFLDRLLGLTIMIVVNATGWAGMVFVVRLFW